MLFRPEHESAHHKTQADQQAARRGDVRAFGRLVAAHREQIYALSYRILGDEQAAVEAAQAAVRLAVSHSATLPVGEFQLWLWHWVVSACQARWRPAGAVHTGPGSATDASIDHSLQSGLCHLPLELCLALVLVDVTGLDFAQAATVLGAGREQVSGWVAEGRARLTLAPDRSTQAGSSARVAG